MQLFDDNNTLMQCAHTCVIGPNITKKLHSSPYHTVTNALQLSYNPSVSLLIIDREVSRSILLLRKFPLVFFFFFPPLRV